MLKKATSVIEPTINVKKAMLAKLPEENKVGWAMLEQNMNKESLKKEIKEEAEDISDVIIPHMNLKKVESYNQGYVMQQ